MLRRSMQFLPAAAICSACIALTAPGFATAARNKAADLGTLGGRFTVVNDINAAGEIIGYSETSAGQIHAFLYVNGAMQDLGTLGGPGSLANAINDLGQVTGFALTARGEAHAFLYSAGAMVDLGPTGTTSAGKAIDLLGQVAGQAGPSGGASNAVRYTLGIVNAFGHAPGGSTSEAIGGLGQVTGTFQDQTGSHAFLYNGGQAMIDLMPGYSSFVSGTRSINFAGSVTGGFQVGTTFHGFVYANGRARDLGSLGGGYTVPTAINSLGQITGVSARKDGEHHAFIYSPGGLTDVGTLGGNFSVGYALNDQGQVAGESMTSSGQLHAFASQHGKLIDLGELVEGLMPGSVVESFATGITASGVVIGRYTISTPADPQMPTKTRSFIATIGPPGLLQGLLPSLLDVGSGKQH